MIGKSIISRLPLGYVVATPSVLAQVPRNELEAALERHRNRDWGDVCPQDWAANDYALTHRGRILSAYRAADDIKFWIITEANRSSTTVLLPDEY